MLTEQNGIQVDKFYPPTDWQYSFPEGYTRLEYLESTGTQYIDTGIVPTADLGFQITFLTNNNIATNNYGCIFGGRYNSGNNDFQLTTYIDPNTPTYKGTFRYGVNSIIYNAGIILNQKQTVSFHYPYYTNPNGSRTTVSSYTWNTNAQSIYLFALNNAGNFTQSGNGCRIYSCIFYDDTNNTILKQFIPAKRNSDNKPGMLDLANTDGNGNYVFYVNAASSGADFTIGPALYTNKSQIDIRQKNNTNFGKNYEFNANDELTWANPNMYLTGKVNYTKVGSPTIVDNVASGFSNGNYLKINNVQELDKQQNLEIKLKFNISNLTTQQDLISCNSYGLLIRIRTNGTIQLYMSSSGTNWNLASPLISSNSISINTDYFMKFIFNGSSYKLKISTDDINYIDWITLTSDSMLKFNSGSYFGVGSFFNGNTNWFSGSIDLSQTYIKVNDKLWFYGKNYTTSNIAVVPAGLTYNNTTTPSKGYVDMRTQVFTPAPEGVTYKRERHLQVVSPEDNTITLLYGIASDYSKYSKFGLLAQVSSGSYDVYIDGGSYDVYIDGVLYNTFTSNTQCDIEFNPNETGGLGPEYVPIGTARTPEELVLHKIVIKPTTSGATITGFKTSRTVAATGTQEQGVMWSHFELTNNINISSLFYNNNSNNILQAVTAKGDIINTSSSIYGIFRGSNSVEYFPLLDAQEQQTANIGYAFNTTKLKRIRIKDIQTDNGDSSFSNSVLLEQINGNNINLVRNVGAYAFNDNRNLKIIPFVKNNMLQNGNAYNFFTNGTELFPTKIDISDRTNMIKIDTYGTSTYPMRGLRGLKVSNEAPFTGTSPQINVSYTGLDRDALVELFNSMPDVSEATDGITRQINITAATGNNLTQPSGSNVTIDENGVASGFSSSDYLKLTQSFSVTNIKKVEEQVVFTTGTIGTQQLIMGGQYSAGSFGFELRTNGKMMFRVTYVDIDNTTRYAEAQCDTILNANTKYKAIGKFDRKDLFIKLEIYNENNILIDEKTYIITSSSFSSLSGFGDFFIGAHGQRGNFNGSIDLENTYIKVGQNYLMKGQILDSDRAIATGKNWDITG